MVIVTPSISDSRLGFDNAMLGSLDGGALVGTTDVNILVAVLSEMTAVSVFAIGALKLTSVFFPNFILSVASLSTLLYPGTFTF